MVIRDSNYIIYLDDANVVQWEKKEKKSEAPPRFELGISCLLDRRFNQLSHGAVVIACICADGPVSAVSGSKTAKRMRPTWGSNPRP